LLFINLIFSLVLKYILILNLENISYNIYYATNRCINVNKISNKTLIRNSP